jgi:hypothetical protein
LLEDYTKIEYVEASVIGWLREEDFAEVRHGR